MNTEYYFDILYMRKQIPTWLKKCNEIFYAVNKTKVINQCHKPLRLKLHQ